MQLNLAYARYTPYEKGSLIDTRNWPMAGSFISECNTDGRTFGSPTSSDKLTSCPKLFSIDNVSTLDKIIHNILGNKSDFTHFMQLHIASAQFLRFSACDLIHIFT
jgi:hypothetical protein